tara:strand:+ start:18750 stop:19982 length:1233 start_codon:yes stop_codon:yes gene_type:complete
MKRTLILVAILFSFSLTIEAQNPEFENLKTIDNWLQLNINNKHISGATIMVADKHKIIYSKTLGKSNLKTQRDLEENDYFKIASLSKVITTVAVMKLYEDGYFDLDDPIDLYLPIFNEIKIIKHQEGSKNYTLVKASKKITIRHLLNQTAGFAYDGPIISEFYKEKKISFFNPIHKSLASFMKDLSDMPIIHEPGEKFTYGPSTDILGYLIETVTKQNLEVYLENNIFIPMYMTGTGFNVHRKDISRLVRSYSKNDNNLKAINNELDLQENYKTTVFMGGSGLISTSSDYMKFCQMLLNYGVYENKRIISRKSVELMTSNQIGNIDYPKGFHLILGKDNKFGFGLNVITKKGKVNEFYSQGSYYWEGAYSTTFIIDPKEGFAALMMTQLGGRQSLKVRKDFRKIVYKTLK